MMVESHVDKEIASFLYTQGIIPSGVIVAATKRAFIELPDMPANSEMQRLQKLVRYNAIEGEVIEDGNTNSHGSMVAHWEEHKELP